MMKVALSPVASALLRCLIARGNVARDRICLIDCRSTDWQSLTFTGERHEIALRIAPPHADAIVARLLDGLEDAEFSIPGQIVADILPSGPPLYRDDGGIEVHIEALTLKENWDASD